MSPMTQERRAQLRGLAAAARIAEKVEDDAPNPSEVISLGRAVTAVQLRDEMDHATVLALLDALDAAEAGLAQAWEEGRKPKPTEKACTLCHGDWEGDRMSCMGCHKGIVYGPPVNPYLPPTPVTRKVT